MVTGLLWPGGPPGVQSVIVVGRKRVVYSLCPVGGHNVVRPGTDGEDLAPEDGLLGDTGGNPIGHPIPLLFPPLRLIFTSGLFDYLMLRGKYV